MSLDLKTMQVVGQYGGPVGIAAAIYGIYLWRLLAKSCLMAQEALEKHIRRLAFLSFGIAALAIVCVTIPKVHFGRKSSEVYTTGGPDSPIIRDNHAPQTFNDSSGHPCK